MSLPNVNLTFVVFLLSSLRKIPIISCNFSQWVSRKPIQPTTNLTFTPFNTQRTWMQSGGAGWSWNMKGSGRVRATVWIHSTFLKWKRRALRKTRENPYEGVYVVIQVTTRTTGGKRKSCLQGRTRR